jgi:hypothetical protein
MAGASVKTTMGKLEDIPKKQIFNTPEHYFDKLPSQIQSRVVAGKRDTGARPFFRYALQYALPLVFIAVIVYFYIRPAPDAVSILATVDTEDIIDYLHDSPLTTEDLLEDVEFNSADLEAIENEVYDLKEFDNAEIDLEWDTL